MSLTYTSNLETGGKVPSLTTLIRLAAALNWKVPKLVKVFDKDSFGTNPRPPA
jgi:transcriptional regulator with XRE-family HTH domain